MIVRRQHKGGGSSGTVTHEHSHNVKISAKFATFESSSRGGSRQARLPPSPHSGTFSMEMIAMIIYSRYHVSGTEGATRSATADPRRAGAEEFSVKLKANLEPVSGEKRVGGLGRSSTAHRQGHSGVIRRPMSLKPRTLR